jgi:Trp operon repressor
MLVTFDENSMPVYNLDAALDITRTSLIEDGKEIEQKDIITKLISSGMSIEELSQKLNISITDINNISNQNATAKEKK